MGYADAGGVTPIGNNADVCLERGVMSQYFYWKPILSKLQGMKLHKHLSGARDQVAAVCEDGADQTTNMGASRHNMLNVDVQCTSTELVENSRHLGYGFECFDGVGCGVVKFE